MEAKFKIDIDELISSRRYDGKLKIGSHRVKYVYKYPTFVQEPIVLLDRDCYCHYERICNEKYWTGPLYVPRIAKIWFRKVKPVLEDLGLMDNKIVLETEDGLFFGYKDLELVLGRSCYHMC